jgi:hypothetical protein
VASWLDEVAAGAREHALARMNVQARIGRTEERVAVFLSVTDDFGKPINDLATGDIFVRALDSGAPAPEVAVTGLMARGEGLYVLPLALAPLTASWPPGEHVLVVVVRRVFDRGQTLAVLTVP